MDDKKITDISHLVGKYKNVTELKEFADDLFKKLQVAVIKIEERDKEIAHLRSLLEGAVQPLSMIPPELLVCEMEIKRLQTLAAQRDLSFEEAKKFDIFNKNLLAIRKQMSEQSKKDSEHELFIDEKTLLQVVNNDSKEGNN